MIDSLAFPLAFRLFFLRVSIDFHRFAFGFPVVLPWFFLCFARAFSLPLRVRFFPSFFLCFPLSTRPTTNLRPTPVRFVRSPRTKRTGAKEKEKDGKGRKRKENRPSWTTSGCVSKRANQKKRKRKEKEGNAMQNPAQLDHEWMRFKTGEPPPVLWPLVFSTFFHFSCVFLHFCVFLLIS